jgi:hypothetical protein
VAFTGTGNSQSDANNLVAALQAALVGSVVSAEVNSDFSITITHQRGGDIVFVDGSGAAATLSKLFTAGSTLNYYSNPSGIGTMASLWGTMVGNSAYATPSATPLTTTPLDGALWYDSYLNDVDIMVCNGSRWVGYRSVDTTVGSSVIKGGKSINNPFGTQGDTDPNGPIISASMPKTQSTGTTLANGDLWIYTGDIENYPIIYKWDFANKKWVLIDNTDQVTSAGIVFGDARWSDQSTNGNLGSPFEGTGAPDTIVSLLASNFLPAGVISTCIL